MKIRVKISNINNILFWIVLFLTFLGFYTVLLLGINAGMAGFTRQLSIPMRMLIGVCCIILFLLNYKNRRPYLIWFTLFISVYLTRIFFDVLNNEFFYISYTDLIFYFISFCIIPFISVSKIDFSKINIKKTYSVFLASGLFFALMAILLYGSYIGEVTRLTTSRAGEDVINPLIISYCSTLVVGIILTFLYFNKTSRLIKLLSIAAVTMSVVPFFLGASRGAILAVFFPFILMGLSNLSIKNIFKYILYLIIFIGVLVYLDSYFESGLIDRFLFTAEAIEMGDSSAGRLQIWEYSLLQFINNPILGDKLNTDVINFYPHNIIIEVLQTTGIIGFVPFSILLFKGFKASVNIYKYNPEFSWITVFFLQAFVQNMFSGAIYSAAWFWTSLAIILSFDFYLKNESNKFIQ